MANEIEFLMYLAVLMGCAYTSYQVGLSEGIHRTIRFFHEEGVIDLNDED